MMKGFNQQYSDFTDYILKCTAQIWEGRDMASLDWHYADDIFIRTPSGFSPEMVLVKLGCEPNLSY